MARHRADTEGGRGTVSTDIRVELWSIDCIRKMRTLAPLTLLNNREPTDPKNGSGGRTEDSQAALDMSGQGSKALS